MGGGDFSTEAYEQLREAYSKEQQRQVDDELRGTQIMGQDYGLETVPVDSPWADKIEKWEYPSGRGQHMDEKQSPDEILQIMRESAQERINAAKEAEEADEAEAEEDGAVEETEGNDIDIAEMTDEEFDSHIDAIIEGDDDEDEDEDEDDDESEVESEDDDEESDAEEETDEDEESEVEPDDLAVQIAELRAELESMQFVSDSEEEPESDESE